MNKKLAAAKNFVVAHKTGILVTALAVTTTAAVLSRVGLKQHDAFLKANDLYDAFYAVGE